MTLFLTASSFYRIFIQVSQTFNSTVVLQVGFLKHLGDVATVLLDLVCLSLFCFFMSFQTDLMMIRSDLCVENWLLSDSLCKQKSYWIITINGKVNVWKCKLIFPTDTLQQKNYYGNNFGHHCMKPSSGVGVVVPNMYSVKQCGVRML